MIEKENIHGSSLNETVLAKKDTNRKAKDKP